MSFLSFLSSHRLHWGAHRPWIDPLPVQLDLILHEKPAHDAHAINAGPADLTNHDNGLIAGIIPDLHRIGFRDEPGP